MTLVDPQPNLFRFAGDGAQSVAGLGTYAYRELGWRSAVVLGDNWAEGWELVSGFVSEFCALGGTVTERDWTAPVDVPTASAARDVTSRRRTASRCSTPSRARSPTCRPWLRAAGHVRHHRDSRGGCSSWRMLAAPVADAGAVVVGAPVRCSRRRTCRRMRPSFARAFPAFPDSGLPRALPFTSRDAACGRARAADGGSVRAAGDAPRALARSSSTRRRAGPARRQPPGDRAELPRAGSSRTQRAGRSPGRSASSRRRADLRRLLRARRPAAGPDHAGLPKGRPAALGALISRPGRASR